MTFHNQVIYQIYPKSFYDSDGDGLGDIRGIIQKIPYIASLGVDMVWLNPFFASPERDNGYDISDYYSINPTMGSMDDVDELIAGLKARGISLMFDMVFNHVSTEHDWFQRALAGDQHYQDYFYIRPAQADGSLPTNWQSKFGGTAWGPFDQSDSYYLCLYDTSQADLNWHNKQLRQELYRVANFWLDRGVRGLRFDVLNVIGKDELLVDAPDGVIDKTLYTDTPQVHTWVKELNRASFGPRQGTITVGEMSSTTIAEAIKYTNPEQKELDMVFNFHHLKVDYDQGQKWSDAPFDFMEFKKILNDWALGMQEGGGWNALFLNNHDQPRAINRFADPHRYRVESATMLAAMIHLHRGTPFIYMGEELGMIDPNYQSIADYRDVETRNAYRELTQQGYSPDAAFKIVRSKARDNSRTPMQWDQSPQAGFTSGQPWLGLAPYQGINLAAEEASGKILPFYRRLIQLRKQLQVISEGTYRPYLLEDPAVYAYTREYKNENLLVINNFFGVETELSIPQEFVDGQVLISNYDGVELNQNMKLAPYQTLAIFKRKEVQS